MLHRDAITLLLHLSYVYFSKIFPGSAQASFILIKKTTIIFSRMGSAFYFQMYLSTFVQFLCIRCQLQASRVATRRYVVLSKIITSASSTWHEIRQRYVDQNWLDHIAWQRRSDRIYREILRVVKRFWTRHGKVGAPPFLRSVINFLATKIQPSVPLRTPPAATDQVVLINFNWLILTKLLPPLRFTACY